MSDQRMLNALYSLRDRIKEEERRKTGKTPIVCTDAAIIALEEYRPRRLDDLKSIPGIGNTFVDKYGERFLDVIARYETDSKVVSQELDESTAETLKALENKLVNIGRRNRLLYYPKHAAKNGFDMFDPNSDNRTVIWSNRSITLCDTLHCKAADRESEAKKYKNISYLWREINKDRRDKGQNNLYVAYPFVIGRIPGENFDIRAPLALIPVKEERSATSFSIKFDDSRDAVYNSTLILAYYKFNNIHSALPEITIDDIHADTFIDTAIKFYKGIGMEIVNKGQGVGPFVDYMKDAFPKYNIGELYIDNCIILGKFDSFSSSIQQDFDSIIRDNKVNELVTDLLENYDPEEDYSSDSVAGEVEENPSDSKPRSVSENDLIYINDLNSSQEQVLSAIRKIDRLVVQGPPGTGKSQTIASLICDFVNRGKTVLMVSEKKTALDVVYSRLGNVSKYTMILDDVSDKAGFFGQLNNMLNLPMHNEQTADLTKISNEIDGKIRYLEELADRLYVPDSFGIEPYKLYEMGIDSSDSTGQKVMASIRQGNDNSLFKMTYEQVSESKDTFESVNLVMDAEQYCEYVRRCRYLPKFPENYDSFRINSMRTDLDSVNKDISAWKSKGFLSRFFSKKKTLKNAHDSVYKYFPHDADEITSLFVESKTDELYKGFNDYADFNRVKPVYERLNESEKIYLKNLLPVKTICNDSILEANSELYNQTLRWHLDDFQSRNPDIYATISQFDDIINSISKLIDKKKAYTINRTTMMLEKALYENIIMAKRSGDIKRTAEKKSRMSVSTFVHRYGYELFRGIKVWLMTPEVVSEITPLETGLFDLVVFDEASQMFVEKGIPSILRAKKVIIAGDSKQLRPNKTFMGRMELDEDDEDYEFGDNAALEEESLLDLAKARYRDVLLNFHYRSKYEELIAFSNYAFYRGRLYVSPNKSVPQIPPIQVHKVEGALWSNQTNQKEAEKVIELLKTFFKERKEKETIGIITFNKKQTDLIWDLIDQESAIDAQFNQQIRAEMDRRSEGNEDIGLFVRNIENVQGDERDVIIFSIGYAKNADGRLINMFGSLSQKGGENRLNVAISRAKKHIDIAMSFDPSELNVSNSKNDGPRLLKKYLEYSCAISDGNEALARQILQSFGDTGASDYARFDSPFEEQVYEALRERGLDVDTQVGIGGYSIDLAVKKKGQYVLGVECDGKLYHSSVSARERDYHRQKYLESRGWRIHRIWSPNWWKDPQGEVDKIVRLVDAFTPANEVKGYIKPHKDAQYVDTTARDYEYNVAKDGREKRA